MAHILVVEDDPDIRRLITAIMGAGDHRVEIAEDGQKALDALNRELPDLVVLDVMMPLMDGFMVLKQMRVNGLREFTRVLLLTARTAESDWVRGFKLGADGYLTKKREGRRTRYKIDPDLPLRDETQQDKAIGDLLGILGWKRHQRLKKQVAVAAGNKLPGF